MRHIAAIILVALIAPGRVASQPRADGWLLVANKADRALGIIDPATGIQVAAVPEGGVTGHEVIASPDGTIAYVSCDVPGKIAAIRTSDWTIDKIIDAGKYADGLAWAAAR